MHCYGYNHCVESVMLEFVDDKNKSTTRAQVPKLHNYNYHDDYFCMKLHRLWMQARETERMGNDSPWLLLKMIDAKNQN